MNGFFVFVSKRPTSGKGKETGDAQWTAVLTEETKSWMATTGNTPEAAVELQRAQYQDKLSSNKPVPKLRKSSNGPMASGQMTRFVAV